MRTPTYEDLSKEQDNVCVLAPLDGMTLVSGPPGTGKTVVAFYRAETAAKKGQTPKLVMFNKVLNRYTSNASKNPKVVKGVSTWHVWMGSWWKAVFGQWAPQVAPYKFDWEAIIPQVLALANNEDGKRKAFHSWGHLIIDEGQDFANGFYRMAQVVLVHAAAASANGVALTVFADENQRLNADVNSSLKEIEDGLAITSSRHYRLTRNYRNTYEIARVAAHFYCGLPTGIPALPEGRRGNKPRIMRLDSVDAAAEVIARFIRTQSDLEVGVFLPKKKLQKKYFKAISDRLKGVKGVKVQRYTSEDGEHGDVDKLKFDSPGVVTVLCDMSCKGLEFDAVFIPELQERRWDPAAIDHMRMQLYVLSSRARQHLTYMYTASAGAAVPILAHFPDSRSDLLEWSNG